MRSNSAWPSTRHSLLMRVNNWSDDQAWQTMVTTYAPLVFRYARRKGLQTADAEDIAQDSMLKIRKFEYDPAKGRFRSWLAVTAQRLIRDHQVRESRPGRRGIGNSQNESATPVEDSAKKKGDTYSIDPEWEELYFLRIAETALLRIKGEFAESHWDVYSRLNSIDNKDNTKNSAPSLAKEFGISVGAVYKLKHKINLRLKEELEFLAGDLPVSTPIQKKRNR